MRRRSTSPAAAPRQARLAEQIQQELALALQSAIKDPRIGLVTVTGVELTPDYAYASVHYTVLPDGAEQRERCAHGLRSAAGYLRRELGRRIRMHTLPQLRFHYDASTGRGMAMSRLIDEALALTPAQDGGGIDASGADPGGDDAGGADASGADAGGDDGGRADASGADNGRAEVDAEGGRGRKGRAAGPAQVVSGTQG